MRMRERERIRHTERQRARTGTVFIKIFTIRMYVLKYHEGSH